MVKEFKNLPTYDWLTGAGITPSTSKTYTRTQIQNALENQFGASVYIGCDGSNLNEFWYHFNVKGPLIGGEVSFHVSNFDQKIIWSLND